MSVVDYAATSASNSLFSIPLARFLTHSAVPSMVLISVHCLGGVGMGKEERGGDQESKIKVLAVHEYFMYLF